MAGDWEVVRLDQIYEFSSGLSKPRSEFGSGYPFLSFKDVFYNIFVPNELTELVKSTEHERLSRSVRRGDVFLTRTSETMEELGMSSVALSDVAEATFNGFTKRLRPKSDGVVVPEYAGYFFRGPSFRREVTAMSSLSTRASLNNEMLSRLTITLPPVDTQAAIGSLLKAFDDKIELNQRMSQTLEAMARAIFKSWFKESRSHHSEVVVEDYIATGALVVNDGYRAKRSELAEHGLPFARAGNLKNGFDFSNAEYLAAERVAAAGFKVSQPNDSVFTSKGTVGRIAMVTSSTPRFVYSPQLCFWRVRNDDVLDPIVLFFWMKESEFRAQIEGLKGQTDMADYVSLRDQRQMRITLPGLDEQRKVSAQLRPLVELIDNNEAESRTLAALRDALLPQLLSGELRVPDAEKFIERSEAAV